MTKAKYGTQFESRACSVAYVIQHADKGLAVGDLKGVIDGSMRCAVAKKGAEGHDPASGDSIAAEQIIVSLPKEA